MGSNTSDRSARFDVTQYVVAAASLVWRIVGGVDGVLTISVCVSWTCLIRDSISWIWLSLLRDSARLNLILLGTSLAVLGHRTITLLQDGRNPWRFAPRTGPVLLTLSAAVGVFWADNFVGVHHLSLLMAGAGTYGLAGLYLPKRDWRRGLVAAALFIAVLPHAELMDVYLGFPARLLTSKWVEYGLPVSFAGEFTSETILVFENRIAHVDLPCSGVKSLWSGAVLCLTLTWMDRRRIGFRWLICVIAFAVALLCGNVLRVLVLVLVGLVADYPDQAAWLHLPMGLVSFAAASFLFFFTLRWVPRWPRAATPNPPQKKTGRKAGCFLKVCVIVVFAVLAVIRTGEAEGNATYRTGTIFTLLVEQELGLTLLPLTATEQDHFSVQGADMAVKYRFNKKGIKGSLLITRERSFRSQHRPERCLAADGLCIRAVRTHLVKGKLPTREVSLANHDGFALYWFQSDTLTTDDYTERMWTDLTGSQRGWVLVSILFDTDDARRPSGNVDTEQWLLFLHRSVAEALFLKQKEQR